MHKNWREIFIKYSQDTAKHIYTQAPKTQQILLITNFYIDESE